MTEPQALISQAQEGMRPGVVLSPRHLGAVLPPSTAFDADSWDVGEWQKRSDRSRVKTLDFSAVGHAQLRNAVKVIVLQKRVANGSGYGAAFALIKAARELGTVLHARPISKMTQADVHNAERRLNDVGPSYLGALSSLVGELRRLYGVAVIYTKPKTATVRHGTKGTEAGRAAKRIHDDILVDLVALITRDDLPDFDRLFVSALALNVACGWRVGELACLPKDCLFEDESGLYVRGFASKNGKIAPKPIARELAPMVREAHEQIVRLTEDGRRIAREWSQSPDPVWGDVVKNRHALLHFARKMLHRWASDPDHQLINPDAAWHRDRGWIDVLGAINTHSTERQAHIALGLDWGTFTDLKRQQSEARAGRLWTRRKNPTATSWLRDRRVCDKHTLFRLMGFATGQHHHDAAIEELIHEALDHQLSGSVLPMPAADPVLERRFARRRPVLLHDGKKRPILHVDEALLVVPKHFVGRQKTKSDDWQALTPEHFIQWLGGTKTTPPVFERYGIVDPRTGAIAKFTSHQIRHWLETQLHRGGLTDAQLASLMNRKNVSPGSVYNQMSNAERREFAKEGIHAGIVGGVVADVVTRADVTKEEAEEILEARLRQINLMPHGICLKDLATEPCPHHMSCFSAAAPDRGRHGACAHLLVDLRVPSQRAAIETERDKAEAMVEMLEDDPDLESSPQIEHFATIARTTAAMLAGEEDT